MLLGAHVSIGGGVKNAPANGKRIGCDVIQIFSKNQQQWAAKPLDAENVAGFKTGIRELGLGPTLVHASYLLNLASSDDALWERSVAGLTDELERAEALGIPFVVFHPGSPKDKGEAWGCSRVAEGVTRALAGTPEHRAMVLLENNAGAGAAIGDTLDELASVLGQIRGDVTRVGVCVDTCHAFVSGYPIHTPDGYDAFFREFDAKISLARLKAFHLNDSKGEIGSRRDRHENIGKGLMGDVVFHRLLTDARFASTPAYIETPFETDEDYVRDLTYLREIASGARAPRAPPAPVASGQLTLTGETAPAAARPRAKVAAKKAPAKASARAKKPSKRPR